MPQAAISARGHQVVVIDNLSRPGAQNNLEWLRQQGSFEFHRVDLRQGAKLLALFRKHADTQRILHLAAQVAVTTSIASPREDFQINALGTLSVLESLRRVGIEAHLLSPRPIKSMAR